MKLLLNSVAIIWKEGPSTIVLYSAFIIVIILSVVSLFAPNYFDKGTIDSFVNMVILLFLADLLFIKIKDKDKTSSPFDSSGITSTTDHLVGAEVEKLMSTSGHIIILNAWIPNFTEIRHSLEKALESVNTTIEITVINSDCEFGKIRGEELNMAAAQVTAAVNHTITEVCRFYAGLSSDKQKRIKMYCCDYLPKISMYACNDTVLVGFCWPKKYSVETSYFRMDGKEGHFSGIIWQYYNFLNKTEIPLHAPSA